MVKHIRFINLLLDSCLKSHESQTDVTNFFVVINKPMKWNKVRYQLDATRWFYWCILSSTCFRYIRPSSGALDVKLQHVVFCTEFLDGWWFWELLRRSCCTVRMVPCTVQHHPHRKHDLRSSSQDHQLNSVALVRTRTIPTERPPPVGEVSANFCG